LRVRRQPAGADAADAARARVVDQRRRRARQLVLVNPGVLLGAVQALLLAGEEDEADRPLRPDRAPGDDAGRLEDDRAAGAVVRRAVAEVPRVEVGTDDDVLVGLLAAPDLADRVEHLDR